MSTRSRMLGCLAAVGLSACGGGGSENDAAADFTKELPGGSAVIAVAAGSAPQTLRSRGYHSVEVKVDGTLWAWGSNSYGQLGDGPTMDRLTPVQIGADSDWASVDADYAHTVAAKTVRKPRRQAFRAWVVSLQT